jgi:hypothetical protein
VSMQPDVPDTRTFTAAVLRTMRELRAHMRPEEYPPFVRDVATFLHATGTRRGLPSFVQAADALCESYGEDGRQRSPRFRASRHPHERATP